MNDLFWQTEMLFDSLFDAMSKPRRDKENGEIQESVHEVQ